MYTKKHLEATQKQRGTSTTTPLAQTQTLHKAAPLICFTSEGFSNLLNQSGTSCARRVMNELSSSSLPTSFGLIA